MNRDRYAIMRKVGTALSLLLAACGAECSGFHTPRRPRPSRVGEAIYRSRWPGREFRYGRKAFSTVALNGCGCRAGTNSFSSYQQPRRAPISDGDPGPAVSWRLPSDKSGIRVSLGARRGCSSTLHPRRGESEPLRLQNPCAPCWIRQPSPSAVRKSRPRPYEGWPRRAVGRGRGGVSAGDPSC